MNNFRKNFVAHKEDFICDNCGHKNPSLGSGTRNHCRKCLCSKHVDDELPGDRASKCGGVMHPIEVIQKNGEWKLKQRCEKCGKVWTNKMTEDDDFEKAVELAEKNQKEKI